MATPSITRKASGIEPLRDQQSLVYCLSYWNYSGHKSIIGELPPYHDLLALLL